MNGQLYAIGGFNGYERLRTVEVFDTPTRKWREVAHFTILFYNKYQSLNR